MLDNATSAFGSISLIHIPVAFNKLSTCSRRLSGGHQGSRNAPFGTYGVAEDSPLVVGREDVGLAAGVVARSSRGGARAGADDPAELGAGGAPANVAVWVNAHVRGAHTSQAMPGGEPADSAVYEKIVVRDGGDGCIPRTQVPGRRPRGLVGQAWCVHVRELSDSDCARCYIARELRAIADPAPIARRYSLLDVDPLEGHQVLGDGKAEEEHRAARQFTVR